MAKTIAVDFDGTIHPYTRGWTGEVPDDEPPTDGAEQALWNFLREGYNVAIFSTRAASENGKRGIEQWVIKHLPNIAENLLPPPPGTEQRLWVTSEKPLAFAYVDDRAVVFRGSWTDVHTDVIALANRPATVRRQ
jgi:hypothetical protein